MDPLTAINELAILAAESATDAHGKLVNSQMAWEIMKEQIAPEDSHVEFLFAHTGEYAAPIHKPFRTTLPNHHVKENR